jgi:hypothetical protein
MSISLSHCPVGAYVCFHPGPPQHHPPPADAPSATVARMAAYVAAAWLVIYLKSWPPEPATAGDYYGRRRGRVPGQDYEEGHPKTPESCRRINMGRVIQDEIVIDGGPGRR